MFLLEPARTRYDLNFSIAGVPVRIHPLFWLISLLLGPIRGNPRPAEVLCWILAVLISILIHELGHSLAYRFYGCRSHIVLYSFGGLAIADSHAPRDGWARVFVSLAGPFAGFVLAAIVAAVVGLAGHPVEWELGGPLLLRLGMEPFESEHLTQFVWDMLFINIWWGLMNLLPVIPLDGGQISRELFAMYSRDGLRQPLWVSVAVGGGVAIYAITRLHEPFLAIMFAYLAYQSYSLLAQWGGRGW